MIENKIDMKEPVVPKKGRSEDYKIHFETSLIEGEASFHLIVQVRNRDGKPVATIGNLDPKDPQLSEKMSLIVQSFRIGQTLK